jgi:hypothetical protein
MDAPAEGRSAGIRRRAAVLRTFQNEFRLAGVPDIVQRAALNLVARRREAE